MSAEVPIELTARQAHAAALDDVNRFRGRCVELFARIERAIGDHLSALSATESDFRVSVPHTFGNRVKELRRVLSPDSPFGDPKLLKALCALQEQLNRRNLIVHSVSEVWMDASGKWLWLLRFPSGKGAPDQREFFQRETAAQFERDLASSSRSLCDQLQSRRQKTSSVSA